MTNKYKLLVGTPEGNRPPRRPRSRCNNLETQCVGQDWIHVFQDRDKQKNLAKHSNGPCYSYRCDDGVRPCLCETAVANKPLVSPPDDISE
jgi:hypothetical protein